tara:strand:+ start:364 stop:1389 length:1026 start_codon:yes stop_codon:yes gene_type:complete
VTIGKWALALGLLIASSAGATAADVTLRLHHMLPPSATAHAMMLKPWADKVAADSGGRIEVQIFPSMQLGGKPPQLYDQVRTGVVDLMWTVVNYTPGRFPTVGVFELPFVAGSTVATSQALQVFYERHLREEFGDVHPIAFHTHAPGTLHMRDHPVMTLEDLKGTKIRAPTPAILQALDLLGATPLGMPVPEVPQALSRGVIDGTALPYEVVVPLKIHELTDSHTEIAGTRGLYTAVFLFAMNKDSYAALPDDLKAVIDANSGVETAKRFAEAFTEAEETEREVTLATGAALYTIEGAELERWKQATQPVVDQWVAEADSRDQDGAALLAEARALIDQFSE